jgi:hypothetical protein
MDVGVNIETEQAVRHTKLVVSHIRKDDVVGRMLQTSIDQLQFQAETSWAVLSQPGKQARMYINPCNLTHTWEFLDSIGSHIIRLEPANNLDHETPTRRRRSFVLDDVANI